MVFGMYKVRLDKVKIAILFQEQPQPALYRVQFEMHQA